MPQTTILDHEVLTAVLDVLDGRQALTADDIHHADPTAETRPTGDRAIRSYVAQRLRAAVLHPSLSAKIVVADRATTEQGARLTVAADGVALDRIVARLRRLNARQLDDWETVNVEAWATDLARRPGDVYFLDGGAAMLLIV